MPFHSHYENLRVARNAPPAVIKAAYRALSQQYHPDKNPDDPEALRIMQIVNEALRVLSDPQLRAEHDAWIRTEEAAEAEEIARRQAHATAVAAAAAAARARAEASAPPRPPPPPPRPQPAPAAPPAPPPAKRSRLRFWLPLLGALAWSAWWILDQPTSQAGHGVSRSPAYAGGASAASSSHATSGVRRGRVNTTQLNVRSGPGTAYGVVARLNHLDEVTVSSGDGTGWLAIRHASGTGYVSESFISIGSLPSTLNAACPSDPPASGTVFSLRPNASGRNALTVEAPAGHHVWVKLKDAAGRTAFSGFVQQGRRQTFNGIGDGNYQAWFLMGPDFSAACRRFTGGETASYDAAFQDYRTQEDAHSVYASHMQYSLRLQSAGNLRTSSSTPAQFLQD